MAFALAAAVYVTTNSPMLAVATAAFPGVAMAMAWQGVRVCAFALVFGATTVASLFTPSSRDGGSNSSDSEIDNDFDTAAVADGDLQHGHDTSSVMDENRHEEVDSQEEEHEEEPEYDAESAPEDPQMEEDSEG